MSIEFGNEQSRKDYLNKKLDDLLSGVNQTYGQVLLEELVTRLERTLADFNEEFEGIVGNLKDSSDRRNQIIHDLMMGKNIENSSVEGDSDQVNDVPDSSKPEMSEWEKRLEAKK